MFNTSTSGQQKIVQLSRMESCIGTLKSSFGMSNDDALEILGLTDTDVRDAYFYSAILGTVQMLTKAKKISTQNGDNIPKKEADLSAHLQIAADLLESAGAHMSQPSESNKNAMYTFFGTTPGNLKELAHKVDNGDTYMPPAINQMIRSLVTPPIIKIPEAAP